MSKQFEGKLALFFAMVALYFSVVWSVLFSDVEMAMWAIVALGAVIASLVYLNEVSKNG